MQDSDDKRVDEPVHDDHEPTLGSLLAAARADKERELTEIAGEMRIDPAVLISLESDELEELGEPVFVKGYIKQYGRQLGLPYDQLLAAYYRQVGSREVDIRPTRSIQLRDERQIAAWIIAGLVLLLVAVVLFVWWLGDGVEPVIGTGPITESTLESGSEPQSDPGPAVPPPAATVVPPQAPSTVNQLGGGFQRRTPAQSSGASAVGDTAQVSEPLTADIAAASATADETVTESPIEPDFIEVLIAFDDDCWTEIRDDRDDTLYYDLASSGSSVRVHGKPPIRVFLGNADSARLTVDGVDFEIPASSRRDELANFTIHQSRN